MSRKIHWCAVFLLLLVSCMAAFWYGSQRRKYAAENLRAQSMRAILNGIANFQSSNGSHMPADVLDLSGTALFSWRVSLLNYVDARKDLFNPPRVRWDRPKMEIYRNQRYELYSGSNDKAGEHRFDAAVLAVTGRDTGFSDRQDSIRQTLPGGSLPENLLLLMEVPNSSVHWMEPVDLVVKEGHVILRGKPFSIHLVNSEEGFHVAFADNSVWFLSKDVPLERLVPLMTLTSARTANRQELIGKYRLKSDPP